jgi:hypothetical protein
MLNETTLRAAVALALALCSVTGCNAVLGIEEARLAEVDQSLVCALPEQRPVDRCETTNDCEGCLVASCGDDEIKGCVDDTGCRKALFNHRVCLRDDCEDDTGACAECLGQTPGAECLADCGEQCSGGEMVPLCDLFCACMETKCGGDASSCLEDCRTQDTPDWELECVISHCELADFGADHCLHATHELRRCPTSKPAVIAGCPAHQGLVGYGCKSNLDCCSGLCGADHSCQ